MANQQDSDPEVNFDMDHPERDDTYDFKEKDADHDFMSADRSHVPSIVPDPFTGEEDWEQYCSYFEDCANLARWPEKEKLLFLIISLRQQTRVYYSSLPVHERRSYRVLTARLEQRFGKTRQSTRWLSKIQNRIRGKNESIASFGDEIRLYAQRAYASLGSEAQEMLALEHFYKSLSPEMRCRLMDKDCRTIRKAVEVVERYEDVLERSNTTDESFLTRGVVAYEDDSTYDLQDNQSFMDMSSSIKQTHVDEELEEIDVSLRNGDVTGLMHGSMCHLYGEYRNSQMESFPQHQENSDPSSQEKCWLCEGMFPSRTSLMKHMISAEHRCLTVLCPWCKGKRRTFTRVSDLEIHVKKGHNDIKISKDRFSRNNGFYFAIYPKDYARIAETVTEYESDAAYDVRKAVREWAEEFEDRKERIEKWNKGWKDGLKEAELKNGDRHGERRDGQNVDRRDSRTEERRDDGAENRRDSRAGDKRDGRTEDRRDDRGGDRRDGRTEERRDDRAEDRRIDRTGNRRDDRVGDSIDIRTEESRDERAGDRRDGRAENRRDDREDRREDGAGNRRDDRVGDSIDIRTEENRDERAGDRRDGRVENRRDDREDRREDGAGNRRDDRVGDSIDIRTEESIDERAGDRRDGRVENRRDDREDRREDGAGNRRDDRAEDSRDIRTQDTRDGRTEQRRDIRTEVTRNDGAGEQRDNKSEDRRGDGSNKRKEIDEVEYQRQNKQLKSDDIDESWKGYKDNIEVGASEANEEESTHPDSNSDSSSSSSSSSISSTSVVEEENSLKSRALKILQKGAMPLCPPAKRNWTQTFPMNFGRHDDYQLLWPPTNWKGLSPDQKLMAHEHVAILLENTGTQGDQEFPVITRKTLLDKYNFFAMDGEKKPQESDEESERIEAKIRHYYFSYMVKVARGEIPDSRTAWSLVKTLENCDRWTDTDPIAEELERKNIKIKI